MGETDNDTGAEMRALTWRPAVTLAALFIAITAGISPAGAAASIGSDAETRFPPQRMGSRAGGLSWSVTNNGDADTQLTAVGIVSGDVSDFEITRRGTCAVPSTLRPGSLCYFIVDFTPKSPGQKAATIRARTDAGDTEGTLRGEGLDVGYIMVGNRGAVYPFGAAVDHGSPTLNDGAVAVDIETHPRGQTGYWVVDSLGRVTSYGPGQSSYGNAAGLSAGETVTSMSATRSGEGYWLFTNKGRVLTFGNAPQLGDMSATPLNGPVLDSIPTPSGNGYYMVASDGGVFTFGDATFAGSMGGTRLNAPVQSLVPDADGTGYWLVASDGGIFAFDAEFYGSMGSTKLNKPVTGMVGSTTGKGYLMVGEDGGIFTFGDVEFRGSLGATPPAVPITSVAPLRPINYTCC